MISHFSSWDFSTTTLDFGFLATSGGYLIVLSLGIREIFSSLSSSESRYLRGSKTSLSFPLV